MTLHMEVSNYNTSAKWSVRLAFAVSLYVIGAFSLWPRSFLTLLQLYAVKFAINVPILMVLGTCTAGLLFGRGAPARYAINLVKERWRRYAPVFFFFFLGLTAFSTYKTAIPSVVPFYADPWLADIDVWLHGVAPWKLAHWFDSDLWGLFIFESYKKLWFAEWFGGVLFVAMWSKKIERIRYFWALFLTFAIVGTILALLLSSVGPIFYDRLVGGNRFDGLRIVLDGQAYSPVIREYADYLVALYLSGKTQLGSGISAMPSVHVALATLNAYFLSSINRWLGFAGWFFAALILFSTVYTGFHHAVDGYVSIIVVSAIWWITGRFVREQHATEAINLRVGTQLQTDPT